MKLTIHLIVALGCGVPAFAAEFEKPVRLKGGKDFVRVEAPGYAAPCLHDVDGDGKLDLVVGQFNKGKLKIYKSLGDMKFAEGTWLKAGSKPAEVPGVW